MRGSGQKMKNAMLRQRLASLDAFRGLTIAGMILVNNPGSEEHVYPPLRHADWHGWTPTDVVFPFFVFILTLREKKKKTFIKLNVENFRKEL